MKGVAFGSSADSWVVLHAEGAAWGDAIPDSLKAELGRQTLSNIEFLSMGPDDQWFIRSTNGVWQIDYGRMPVPNVLEVNWPVRKELH